MFMHDANRCATAVWTHRLLASIVKNVADDRLLKELAQASRSEGRPSAADVVFGNGESLQWLVSLLEPIAPGDDSVLPRVWPAGRVKPIHDHDRLWGTELVLDAALLVEFLTMAVGATALAPRHAATLGTNEQTTLSERAHAHRCRNLSAQRRALSLHAHSDALEQYRAYDRDPARRWRSEPRCTELELALP